MNELTWQLARRPDVVAGVADAGPRSATAATVVSATPAKLIASSKSYSVEATTQVSQVINSPEKDKDQKFYFEDLDPELQKVLHAQLQKPGDVSAVIEMPNAFLLFIAKDKTNDALSVASLTIPKRGYDEWLAQQPATVVHPTGRHAAVLADLLRAAGVGGNLISDAHLAALALEHGARICTFDRDFGRFTGLRTITPA